MTTAYRAENVGSFLRPPELLEARAAHASGKLALEKLRLAEDRTARKVWGHPVRQILSGQRKGGMGNLPAPAASVVLSSVACRMRKLPGTFMQPSAAISVSSK